MTGSSTTQRSTPLSALLAGYVAAPLHSDPFIRGLALDSHQVLAGDCFFALQGAQSHGIAYVSEAITRGAVAVVMDEHTSPPTCLRVPVVPVHALNQRLGEIAARFFGHPSEDLTVIAVTGTNGKTTVANLCAQALSHLQYPCGYIGTLGAGTLEALTVIGLTTPDSITLQREFKKLVDANYRAVAMEASSHALAQSRLAGTAVDVAIFTGLGHDHLDYHGNLASYGDAKRRLFEHRGLRHAVFNVDDAFGRRICTNLNPHILTWGCSLLGGSNRPASERYVCAKSIEYKVTGTRIEIATHRGDLEIASALVGDFNAQNLLVVLAVLLALNFSLQDAAAALGKVTPVVGRLESFGGTGTLPRIYVDYAHSPDSLERVLKVLRSFAPARVFTVFGCGGNRDRSKRPLMGVIAQRYSDHVYLTNDNPRDENPTLIVNEILAGLQSRRNTTVIEDRTIAVNTALDGASVNDIVLIAGKGHETGQVTGKRTVPFSDQTVVRRWIESRS